MSTLIKPATLLMALGLISGSAWAQKPKKDADKKENTIIIRPEKNNQEKYTIVVDGNTVTINGKPVDEFKGEGIDIISRSPSLRLEGTEDMQHLFKGGWNMAPEANVLWTNQALLGVVTEKAETGVNIQEISKESAAEKAGLQKGDIITSINEIKIETPENLRKTVSQFKPEDKIEIAYKRDGKEYKTTAILKKNTYSSPLAFSTFPGGHEFSQRYFEPGTNNFRLEVMGRPKLGMQIKDTENESGAKVTEITEESAAAKAGLKKEDIITAINGKPVNTVAEIKKEIASRKEKEEISIDYLRNDKKHTTAIKFPKKLEQANL